MCFRGLGEQLNNPSLPRQLKRAQAQRRDLRQTSTDLDSRSDRKRPCDCEPLILPFASAPIEIARSSSRKLCALTTLAGLGGLCVKPWTTSTSEFLHR
jgi:hypothetical protein